MRIFSPLSILAMNRRRLIYEEEQYLKGSVYIIALLVEFIDDKPFLWFVKNSYCMTFPLNFQKLQIPRALIGQIQQQKVQSLEARLTINGGRLGGLRHDDFQSSKMITITIPKISLFIQTDKPIYKPGQTGNKTNHLCSFMDGSLNAEACISQSLANQLESPNQLATSYQ